MKQNKSTSTSERTNVRNDMWRKKVDNNLFRYHETTIPRWIASKWNLEKYFPDKNGLLKKSDKNSQTEINFKNRIEQLKEKYRIIRDQKIRERVEALGVKIQGDEDREIGEK